MNSLLLVIIIPILTGLLGFLIGRLRNEWNFLGGLLNLYYSFRIFLSQKGGSLEYPLGNIYGVDFKLRVDNLSGFILLFVSLFGFLIIIYSLRYCRRMELLNLRSYYFYFLLTLAGANGILLSNNLFLLLIFWVLLLMVLYGFFLLSKENPSYSWRKTLTIIGISDFLMFLGIVLLLFRTGNVAIKLPSPLSLTDPYLVISFLFLAIGALTKVGAIPFSFWIPETAKVLPTSLMALIPASLDKLLAIYLLIRISIYIFDLRTSVALSNLLMIIGAATILVPVLMAMRQKEAMSFLFFHSASQVGYILLGIGSGIPIGVAGGIFHMLNSTLYKSGLFLTFGAVESWTKETKLDNLNGLAMKMPITFFSFLICALAISGVPPLNGFFSKWLIYQGILDLGKEGNKLFVFYLITAIFGSAFTFASFLRLTHFFFSGERAKKWEKVREVGFSMWLPGLIITLLCLGFGIFADSLPMRHFIYPSLPYSVSTITGYQPVWALIIILIGLLLGFLLYHFYGRLKGPPILDKFFHFWRNG